MADDRYNRWQALAIGQLTVAIGFISGAALAGLGAGLSLIKDKHFILPAGWKCVFTLSEILLILTLAVSGAAVVTRMLDFRLTARKVRKDKYPDYKKSLTIFGCDKDDYGRATWGFFWLSCIFLILGMTLLVLSLVATLGDKRIAVSARDPVTTSPQFYKVLLENDQVRVLEYRLKAGEKEPMHSHPAGVVYVLSGATLKFSYPDGRTEAKAAATGETIWRDPVTRAVENTGKTEGHAIAIDLKSDE